MRRLIKKQIAFFSIIIILMVLSIASSSLAYFKNEQEAGYATVATGDFYVTMPSSGQVLSGPIFPMDFSEALDGEGYTFTINNDSDYYYDYYVRLYIETPNNFSGTLLDNQYSHVSLDGYYDDTLDNLTTRVVNGVTYYDLKHSFISDNSYENHTLYVWADEYTPNSEAGNQVYLSLKVEGEAFSDLSQWVE